MHGGNVELLAPQYGFDVDEVIDFSANINPYGPPPELKRVLDESWKEISRYPDPQSSGLRKALAEHHGVEMENITVGNGASELIYWISRLFSFPKAVVLSPAFTEYAVAVSLAGGQVRYVLSDEENDFRHEFSLENLMCLDLPNLVFVGNPNNPTGNSYASSTIQHWIERQLKVSPDTVFVIDESFLPFVGRETEFSLIPFAAVNAKVIILRSMTKIFSIPGLRLGYSIAHPDLTLKLSALMPTWRVNILAQRCGEVLFNNSIFLNNSVSALIKSREELTRALMDIQQLKVFGSSANFLLLKLLSEQPEAGVLVDKLARGGLVTRLCDDFRGLEKGRFLRIAVRKPDENERLVKKFRGLLADG